MVKQKAIYSNKYYGKTKTENIPHIPNHQYQKDIIWSTMIKGLTFTLCVRVQTIIVISQKNHHVHNQSNHLKDKMFFFLAGTF